MPFLPAIPQDLADKGLEPGDLDAILVTGDAYVDHSSFGASIIGRVVESKGYTIGILARPDPDDVEAFRVLGSPRLAWLVSSGAVDSMVSSYTANRKPRSEDEYAPGGNPSLCLRADGSIGIGANKRKNARPDRAVIAYSSMCRQAYKGIPVIIGGIEASLRRLAHYDYWSDTVRRSILLDSKADILVYGMGEGQILEILKRLKSAKDKAERPDLSGIRGTVWSKHVGKTGERPVESLVLPGFDALSDSTSTSKTAYAKAFSMQYANTDPHSALRLVEPNGDRIVVQEPPALPLSQSELDRIYSLDFMRSAHPMYDEFKGVPALNEVKFSLLSARGCFGACSFCAITFHQGRAILGRSVKAIVNEAKLLTALPDFKGYIHDVGGPTANFRQSACKKMDTKGACTDRRCLSPEPCPALMPDHREYVELLRTLRSLPKVKKVFVRSGVRYDYLLLDKDPSFFKELVEHHVSGQLKVAPEHVSEKVLALMGKPPKAVYDRFAALFAQMNESLGKKQFMIPYFISAHPGSGLKEAIELAEYLRDTKFIPDQVQDFYPTPGTLATAMYWCESNPLDGSSLHVAKGARERAMQRALLQFKAPENADLVREALRLAGREDLIGEGQKCLVGQTKSHNARGARRQFGD
jgi:uncharacterized radical SAM protein YgiQ